MEMTVHIMRVHFTSECPEANTQGVLDHHLRLAHLQGNEIFLTKVTAWQRQLGLVDASLSTWQDVQKLWQALESIYVGSEDIQKQLPQDSQRFNFINAQFRVSSAVCAHSPASVQAACLSGCSWCRQDCNMGCRS